MQPKNKLTRYYNLIRRFSNWRAYLWFKGRGKDDAFLFKLGVPVANGQKWALSNRQPASQDERSGRKLSKVVVKSISKRY